MPIYFPPIVSVTTSVSGADPGASYVVMTLTSSLTNDRSLAVSSGLMLTDGGADSAVTFAINDNTVATVSGTTFTGPISASNGLSGSLQRVGPNLSYLVAGTNMTVTSQSNGQIILGSTATGGSGGGADPGASYVVMGTTASLANERVLTAGAGLTLVDGGADSTATFAINNNTVATVSGTTFTGVVSASAGLSGSLQQVGPSLSYLVAGSNIAIMSQSNGQIIISSSLVPGGGTMTLVESKTVASNTGSLSFVNLDGDSDLTYLLIWRIKCGATTTYDVLPNGLTTNMGQLQHASTTSGVHSLITNNLVPRIGNVDNGSILSGQMMIHATTGFERHFNGIDVESRVSGGTVVLSERTTRWTDTTTNITSLIVSSGHASGISAGSVVHLYKVANTNGGAFATTGADPYASYVVMGITSSLFNERALTAGTGLTLTDAGVGSTATFAINNNTVATVSGTLFTGVVSASAGLSGSLQQVGPNLSYLVAGSNMTVTSQSNGQIVIASTATGGSGADPYASYVVMGTTASLANERALTVGTGLTLTDAGVGSTATLAINNNTVATVSGTTFTGPVSASSGLSGSLQQVGPNLSYLVAGSNMTVTSQSNGQIILGSTAAPGGDGSGADPYASYVVMGITSSLFNERALTAGTGLTLTDAGVGSTATFAINNNTVATVSGTLFTGVVSASAGLSGSLQQVGPNLSYLVAGSNMTVTSQSNGQIILGSTANTVTNNEFLLMQTQVITGSVTSVVFNGLNGNADVLYKLVWHSYMNAAGSIFSYLNGATTTYSQLRHYATAYPTTGADVQTTPTIGYCAASGSILTGELLIHAQTGAPRIMDGLDSGWDSTTYRLSRTTKWTDTTTNVTSLVLTAATNAIAPNSWFSLYRVNISNSSSLGPGADPAASYVVIGTTSSLPNERALIAGSGLSLTDGGSGGSATLAINNNTVATVSGTTFTGVVSASAGLSGSLQQVGPGLSYLVGGTNTTITSQSNGQIIVSNTLQPGYKLIETINVTGAAVTSVTFSNLVGNTDQVYQLVYWDVLTQAHRLDVQPNAATTTYVCGVWYYASNGGSGFINTYTSVALIDSIQNDIAFGSLMIYATSGVQRAFMQSGGWLRPSGATLNGRWDSSTRWTNTADEITSLKIVSSAANGIGIGSRFSLYKVTI